MRLYLAEGGGVWHQMRHRVGRFDNGLAADSWSGAVHDQRDKLTFGAASDDATVAPSREPLTIMVAASGKGAGIVRALQDIRESLSSTSLWYRLAMLDLRNRYRRTVLGPWWNVLSVAILVASLGVVYAFLWRVDYQVFLPYFSAGYVVWVLITSTLNENCNSFVAGANIIRSMTLPVAVHVIRPVVRNLLVFAHALLVYVAVVLILQYPVDPLALLLAPVGLVLLSLNLFWLSLCLASLCTRYRDFIQVVQSVLQIAFFVTPIFWEKTLLESSPLATFLLADLNPFFHLVDVVRGPLTGQIPSALTYLVLSISSVVGFGLAVIVFGQARRRLAYWV